jgi:hypothetical protein
VLAAGGALVGGAALAACCKCRRCSTIAGAVSAERARHRRGRCALTAWVRPARAGRGSGLAALAVLRRPPSGAATCRRCVRRQPRSSSYFREGGRLPSPIRAGRFQRRCSSTPSPCTGLLRPPAWASNDEEPPDLDPRRDRRGAYACAPVMAAGRDASVDTSRKGLKRCSDDQHPCIRPEAWSP